MIVEFSVKNFRSINSLQTISFVATGLKSSEEFSEVDFNNISELGNTKLLKTVGIYGANASGKSNIIMALEYFLQSIRNEASSVSNLNLLCEPFLYQENTLETESFFQIVLFVNNKKYRYGFTVKQNTKQNTNPAESYSNEIITNEWLFASQGKDMVELFTRKGLDVNKNNLPNEEKIPTLNYAHTLFLTHSAAFDNEGDSFFIKSFVTNKTISNISKFDNFNWNLLALLLYEKKEKEFLELLSAFNLKYDKIVLKRDKNSLKNQISLNEVYLEKTFVHKNKETAKIELNLERNESAGTKKIFEIAALIYRAFNIPINSLTIIDEIDSNFHPSLLIKLVALFNNPKINKNNSQLLFTTHDTNLLSPAIMRRDQFYFAEKNNDDATRIYSLADLKGIRNDADFAKQYLAGFYGALPVLENYTNEKTLTNE